MRLDPDAPAWTPGLCSSREHGEGGGVAARRGGMPQREERRESRDGGSHRSGTRRQPYGKQGKNLGNYYRVNPSVRKKNVKKQKKRGRWRIMRGRAARRLATRAALAARKRQQGQLLRVATWNVRTLAVNGANGYGRAYSVLHEAARQDVSVVGMQETRRVGRTEVAAAGFRVFRCGTETCGFHGVGIAVKESLCKTSAFTTEFIDERHMAMGFLLAGHRGAVNFVAAYAPTEPSTADSKRVFWGKLDSLVRRIPSKECVFVLVDANARTGDRLDVGDGRVIGTYGRDELNDNGMLLLNFATENRLALTNTFFETRKGGIWHA
ncbi:unnamed protein product [Ectocarpus sp. CCAP 1310/34]|nr:unnamed protein product [Ectocarpus sp. CCAP 1310/34]